jgi:hypothetical protein
MTMTATTIPTAGAMSSLRVSVATGLRQLAFVTLNAGIVLSPFRARFLLEERRLPFVFQDYTDLLLFWNEIVLLAALGLWLLSLLVQPRRVRFGPLAIGLPVLALAAAICISVPFAEDTKLAAFNAVTLLGFIVFGLFVANEVERISQLVPAIVVMIVVQALVTITQSLEQSSIGLGALGELNLDPQMPGVSILWSEGHPLLLRAYGLSDHPNILGGVLAASMLVLLAGCWRYRDEWFVLAAGAFAVGTAALFVTFSRSAALGLFAGLAVTLVCLAAIREWSGVRRIIAVCVVATLVTVPLVKTYSPFLEGRVNPTAQPTGSPEERSITERGALANATSDVFFGNPIVGVGPGVLPTALYRAHPDFEWHYFPAHIAILVVAAETGAIGATAYGVLAVAPWLLLWLRRRHLTPELIGVSGALLALEVVGLLDYYTWGLDAGRLWFSLVLGLWVVAYRNTFEPTVERS